MLRTKVRIGVIGTGFMGRAHAEIYRDWCDNTELVIIASRSEDHAANAAKELGFHRWTTNWQEVVGAHDVDLVDISAPNHLHRDMIIAAAEAGKPFVIEKPLTRSLSEAEEVMEVVKRTGAKGMYAENLRFSDDYRQAEEIINLGGIGTPYLIRADEMHSGPTHANWFWDGTRTGGGALIDMGIHGLYVIEWLMSDRITKVYAESGVLKWRDRVQGGAEDTTLVMMRFRNGGMGLLSNSWAISGGLHGSVEVFGPEGNIFLGGITRSDVTVFSHRGWGKGLDEALTIEPHVMPRRGWSFQSSVPHASHINELRHFVDCVANDREPLATLEQGYRAMELVDAIYRSARRGMPVEV